MNPTPVAQYAPAPEPPPQSQLRVILNQLGPLLGLIFVFGLFSALRPRTFLTASNIELILRLTAVVGTAALGMTLIIISGGIDLSVGSSIALVTVVIGLFLPHYVTDPGTGQRTLTHGVPALVAALGGVAIAVVCGGIIGALITGARLMPFIVTLGMFGALRGAAKGLANNSVVYTQDTFLNKILDPFDDRALWLLTPGAWIMIILAVLVAAMLRYTRFGRHIFAIGSNEQTARLCGVRVERTKILIYMLASVFFGISGIMQFGFLTLGDPTTAQGMELDIIAAVVIGGASLSGGQGTIVGSLVGALIMSVVANGCVKLGLENWVQQIVTGGIILVASLVDRLRQRRAN